MFGLMCEKSVVVWLTVASFATVRWFSWLSKVGRVTARFQSPAEMVV